MSRRRDAPAGIYRRTVDVESLGVAQLLLFGVHADVAAQEGVLGLHLRRLLSALRLRLCTAAGALACRFGTYGGTVTPRPSAPAVSTCTSVPTKISTASSGARCARHHHQPVQRAECAGRRRALRSLSHTSGRVRSVTRCVAGASAAGVAGEEAKRVRRCIGCGAHLVDVAQEADDGARAFCDHHARAARRRCCACCWRGWQ